MLQTRQQNPNQPVTVFVEEMQKIFRHVDADMAEEKKIQYLMRAVKEQLFIGLIRNPPKTIAEIVTEAATLEKTVELRARQYSRNFPALTFGKMDSDALDGNSLRATIQTIFREELQKLLPAASPHVAAVTSIVRDELRDALGTALPTQTVLQSETVLSPAMMTYADAIRGQAPLVTRTELYTPSPRPQPVYTRRYHDRGCKGGLWLIKKPLRGSLTSGGHQTDALYASTVGKPATCSKPALTARWAYVGSASTPHAPFQANGHMKSRPT